jgi:hypothetical protein
MILIVCEVILKNEKQDNANGNTECETEDVEGGKEFVLQENSYRELELIHNRIKS